MTDIRQIEPQIQRHLVVTASPGMQLLPDVAQELYQASLHRRMHILVGVLKGKGARLGLLENEL